MKKTALFLLSVWSISILGCFGPNEPVHPYIPYDLHHPDEKIKLSKAYKEISGLAYIGDNQVAGVQDEKGAIYLLDLKDGDKVDKIKFKKHGDFEGVTYRDGEYFVVRSDGELFHIEPTGSKEADEERFETPLSSKNDVEGLCFNWSKEELLILCKEEAGIDETQKGKKAIYRFSLESHALDETPFALIDVDEVKDRVEALYGKRPNETFKPAGLAVHPTTKHIYVVTSVGKLLLVLQQDGKLLDVAQLPPKKFKQAEGITFDDAGNLYISNEGVKGKANILRFQPKE